MSRVSIRHESHLSRVFVGTYFQSSWCHHPSTKEQLRVLTQELVPVQILEDGTCLHLTGSSWIRSMTMKRLACSSAHLGPRLRAAPDPASSHGPLATRISSFVIKCQLVNKVPEALSSYQDLVSQWTTFPLRCIKLVSIPLHVEHPHL